MYHQNWFENHWRNLNDPTINIIFKKEFRMSSETFIGAGMKKQDIVAIALQRLATGNACHVVLSKVVGVSPTVVNRGLARISESKTKFHGTFQL